MPLRERLSIHPIKQSCQVYFPKDFVRQWSFPLARDGEAMAAIQPHQCVVLFPPDADPDWPITLHDPDSIARQPTDVLHSHE